MKGVTLTAQATERLNGKLADRSRRVAHPGQGRRQSPDPRGAREERHAARRDEGLETASRGQGSRPRGEDDHQGAEDPDRSDPLPRADGRPQGSRIRRQHLSRVRQCPSSTQDAKLAASKKYFQHISLLLDDLRTEVKGAQKAKFAQMMLNKAALEIDRLPLLNVDEELLAYGAGVASSLRGMRNLSKNAGLDFQYRKAQMQGNSGGYGGYGYGYGGFYGGGSVAGATTSTYRQETALLQSNELAVLTMLEEKTAEIRKKMTLKYQVEF